MEKNGKLKSEDVCQMAFGDFDVFREKFLGMQFGSMPTGVRPNPRNIAVVRNLDGWPSSLTVLRNMKAICYGCLNNELFSPCNMCVKAMVGECKMLVEEASWEKSRLLREAKLKERGGK